jgi:dolichol-phosphate mannosyltransferase
MLNPMISVVIPVYKAEDCLHALYERLTNSLEQITENYEIILVEDCGGDRSWSIICELAEQDPRVKGIQFSRNFGQHYGITAGLDLNTGEWVVVMDCDLQDRPEEIPRLYAKAQEGYDVVLARRGQRKDPLLKRLTSRLFYAVFNYLTDLKYDREVGNFRIISRKVANYFCMMRERLRFFGGLIDWMGFPYATIDISHDERYSGKSSYTFAKLWKLAVDTIIAYSDKPLRIAVSLGFFISALASCYGVYIVYRAIAVGSPVAGWASLIASLYFLSGIIIMILGILGIYLGKVYDELKGRPLYLIRNKTVSLHLEQSGFYSRVRQASPANVDDLG